MRHGSFCTGIAGLDLAVADHFGSEPAWHCELDPAPTRVLERHFPGVPNLGDLTTLDLSATEPVDIITAGYPCQPFSHAGKRKGSDDERHLWPYIMEAVRVLRPRWVVCENVAGHLTLGFREVLGDLAAAGFDAEWCVLRASDVGAPHRRARLFFVARDARGGGRGGRASGDEPPVEERHRLPPERGQGVDLAAGIARPTSDTRSAGTGRDDRAVPGSARSARRQGVDVHPPVDARGDAAADASGQPEREPADEADAIAGGGQARPVAGGRGVLAAPDTEVHEQREPAVTRPLRAEPRDGATGVEWGRYRPAIDRWARVLGRPAPDPLDGRGRLNPPFVEWMMGYPEGWVDGLSRTQALKALGNAVVTRQAAAALEVLVPAFAEERAA